MQWDTKNSLTEVKQSWGSSSLGRRGEWQDSGYCMSELWCGKERVAASPRLLIGWLKSVCSVNSNICTEWETIKSSGESGTSSAEASIFFSDSYHPKIRGIELSECVKGEAIITSVCGSLFLEVEVVDKNGIF